MSVGVFKEGGGGMSIEESALGFSSTFCEGLVLIKFFRLLGRLVNSGLEAGKLSPSSEIVLFLNSQRIRSI